MSKEEKDKFYFVAFCIEQYKNVKKLDGADVANLFFSSGVVAYLYDNFMVLHTQSWQWLIEEIDDFLSKKQK